MAEGIVYLDVDDEITSAAARIRMAAGTKVVLVVPAGSRIATSRMNFRLLSREAVVTSKRLSIVSGDAASRSLAASAGLPVFGSVGEYESSLQAPVVEAAVVGSTPSPPPDSAPVRELETAPIARKSQRPKRPVPEETAPIASGPASGMAEPERPIERGTANGHNRTPIFAALALVGLAAIVLAVGAYLLLPSATVALTPRREPIGPIQLTVSADPTATVVDAVNGVVPAVRLEVPVEAPRTFSTTGTHIEESAGRGTVTFSNYDTSSGVSIPRGSVVSTEGGVRFRTQALVALQPATVFPAFDPASDSVAVVALKTGEGGNVPANTIRVVPQGQDPVLLRVNNADPTAGGVRTVTKEVSKAEVDKAVVALQADLQTAFDAAIAAGAGAPADTTLFETTAVLGPSTFDVDPATLIGQAVETFDLRLTAIGSVIAVDPRPVRTIAEAQLADEVGANFRLVADSVDIEVGAGSVGEDGQITFQATTRATRVAIVDPAQLRSLVTGRTAAEAKAALAPFGDAVVTLWPDWVTTITGVDSRLTVTIDDRRSGISPTPSGSARPSRSPAATTRPTTAGPSSAP